MLSKGCTGAVCVTQPELIHRQYKVNNRLPGTGQNLLTLGQQHSCLIGSTLSWVVWIIIYK